MNHREYVERHYRSQHEGHGLHYFEVKVKETDLSIGVDQESYKPGLKKICIQHVMAVRTELENYIERQPLFKTSFVPVELLALAPPHAIIMAEAARKAGVGPMAAVAGTFAEAVGEMLRKYVSEVVVENGGDIYLYSRRERLISVFAGESKFSHRIGIKIRPEESPLGICTSSGTVGPSISLGCADAVVIKAKTASLADAVASGAANRVQCVEDVARAIAFAREIPGVTGVLSIKGDQMAAWGEIELVPLR